MTRPKKETAPSQMSEAALITEHRLWADDPNCPNKARRLSIKDLLLQQAISEPLSKAAKYAAERRWCLQQAA